MPEGPEIRLAAEKIARPLAGKVVDEAWFAFPRLQRHRRQLEGQRVRSVEPRGKAMLIRFAGGLNLYSHNQLYGRWYVTAAGELPKTQRQLRVALSTEEHSALLYSASDIELLRDDELDDHPYLARLGPDVLDRKVTAAKVRRRLDDPRFSGRSFGALLLDQGFLGGIGNYLRSEILFAAGIDPSRRPADLDADERKRFASTALSISRRSLKTRGVTNDPSIVRELKAVGVGRSQYRHFVFAREGKPCYRCGSDIDRIQVASRRLYRCPDCQG